MLHEFILHVTSSHSHFPTTPTSEDHTLPDARRDTCEQQLLLNWTSPFTYQGNATTCYHHVFFKSYGLVSLTTKLCYTVGGERNSEKSKCSSLNSSLVITQSWYKLSLDETESFLNYTPTPSSHAPSSHTPSLPVVWLDLDMRLVNGSFLLATSEGVMLEGLSPCTVTSTGEHICIVGLLIGHEY